MDNDKEKESLGRNLLDHMEPEAIRRMFRRIYGDDSEEPAAWVDKFDGRVNVNLREDLFNPIKPQWDGVGCFICCDALDQDSYPVIVTVDDRTGKFKIYLDANTPELRYTPLCYLCEGCARWYNALEFYEKSGSANRYRFVSGSKAWLADGTDIFEITDRRMTGVARLGIRWPYYAGQDEKTGRRRWRSELELAAVVEKVTYASRPFFPPVRQISPSAGQPEGQLPTLEDLGKQPTLEDLRHLVDAPPVSPNVKALDFWKEKK